MENRTVEIVYRAEGSMTRDVNWLNSSHGITLTALQEVASQNMIGDMLRYDDGEIISGQFSGQWVKGNIGRKQGETVGMEGEVEPVASSIKFSVVIKAERWTPARWDTFGVKTRLIKGDLSDEFTQQDRDTKKQLADAEAIANEKVIEFWTKTFTSEEPQIIIDDIEIKTLNGKFILTLDQQPITDVDGTHRFKTLQDAVDAALVVIIHRDPKGVALWSHKLVELAYPRHKVDEKADETMDWLG